MKKYIGERLLLIRGDRSRREVAKTIGISVSTLQMYENGKRIPRDHIKIKLASYYGVSIESLFYGYVDHDSCYSPREGTKKEIS